MSQVEWFWHWKTPAGQFEFLAVVEQTPNSEISIEYNAIADMMIADKYEREVTDHE